MSTQPPTLDQVCAKALSLPCSPSLLPRLILALQKEDSSADEIEKIIMMDASLAATTLRLSNSAYYGGRTVETVSEAIVRLGQREIYRLAALALVNRWGEGSVGGVDQREAGDFSRHALCTALAAEILAETTERVDPQAAYTAGLIGDVGKLAMVHACADFYPAIRACSSRGGTWEDAERAIIGFHNGQVSAQLLRSWNFPPLYVAAAEFCLRPHEGPEEARPLLAHLHGAKYMATTMGVGVAEDGFLFELNTAFLTEWGFTAELIEETMPIMFDRASARLQDKLTYGALKL